MIEKPHILDTDFISSFAWADSIYLLEKLYFEKMIMLDIVKEELTRIPNRIPHIWERIKPAIGRGNIIELSISPLDERIVKEYSLLRKTGKLGSGEAAVMAYARFHGGIVCSNNIRDVKHYCLRNNLSFCTVALSMFQAYKQGLIDREKGNSIWQIFLKKKRKVHFSDFQSVIQCYSSGNGLEQK